MFIGGVFLTLILRPWTISVELEFLTTLAFLGLVVIGTVISFFLFMSGVNLIGPVNASLLNTFEPLSAIFFSVVLLNLKLQFIDFIGFFFIISTVFILKIGVKKNIGKQMR